MRYGRSELPPITMSTSDVEGLQRLATAAASKFPRTADFLRREVDRANLMERGMKVPGLVMMGSRVEFRDEEAGHVRCVTLVYPHEADLDAGRISVLTPVGAALIGLSVGQSIEWQSPTGGWRSLTVLRVHDPER